MAKKLIAAVLAALLCMSMVCTMAFAEELSTNVAKIGETEYATLAEAVAVANADTTEGAVVIEMIADTTFNAEMSISRDIIISGDYAITRADTYTGTLFSVSAGKTLTLDGGLVIDGGNNWTMNSAYYANVINGICGTSVDDSTNKFATSEPGAPVAKDYLLKVNGSLIMNQATVQNNFGHSLINVGANADLITGNGAVITHNTKIGGSLITVLADGATWTIEEGTVISYNHADGGFGVLTEMRSNSDLIINGGEIFENSSVDVNGVLVATYSKTAYIEINGGDMYNNWASYGNNNNWNSLFYLNAKQPGAKLVMNDGHIHDNYSSYVCGISSNGDGVIVELNGGVIEDGISGVNYRGRDSVFGSPLNVTGDVTLENGRVLNHVDIAEGKTLNVETLNVNGAWYAIKFTGGGTVDGNLYIYYGNTATLADGTWTNGLVTVDSVEYKTGLAVKAGATIDGTQVRVLNSVASGDYTNAEEAGNAQNDSYNAEAGANVVSPVLFYHRLTAAQKSNIVVTYDYNGGLDAQGWSGCQITSAETFVPTSPVPTMEGFEFDGWVYAEDNDPESLSMTGIGAYAGEEIAESVRLIAQWTVPGGNEDIGDEDVPLGPTPGGNENIEDEDVPKADVPKTGSMMMAAMSMAATSGAAMMFFRKKKD